MDEGMKAKTKELRTNQRGRHDDDDDGVLQCKIFDGNYSWRTKGTKQMYVCVRGEPQMCVHERQLSDAFLLFCLWGTVIVIHALLKSPSQ